MTAKKDDSPKGSDKSRKKKQRLRRGVGGVIATAVVAGALVGAPASKAALPPVTEQSAYEAALKDGTLAALKQFLQKFPTSTLAEPTFLKLAAMCGGGGVASDPDCEGSILADPPAEPPGNDESFEGRQDQSIY